MLKYASLLGVAHAASTISNVVCNGADLISYDVTVASGTNAPSLFKFGDCEAAHNVDKTGAVSVSSSGDVHSVSFNPYADCQGATDANDATSFSVSMKVIMSYKQTIGGSEVYTGAEEVTLECNFQSYYEATASLGVLTVPVDTYLTVDSTAFTMDIEMDRFTDDNYDTTSALDVIAYNPVYFKVEGDAAFKNTQFKLRVFEITLDKINSDDAIGASLTLYDATRMYACTMMNALDFTWGVSDQETTFSYKAIFLDDDTTGNYRISVKAKACGALADSPQCTAC